MLTLVKTKDAVPIGIYSGKKSKADEKRWAKKKAAASKKKAKPTSRPMRRKTKT